MSRMWKDPLGTYKGGGSQVATARLDGRKGVLEFFFFFQCYNNVAYDFDNGIIELMWRKPRSFSANRCSVSHLLVDSVLEEEKGRGPTFCARMLKLGLEPKGIHCLSRCFWIYGFHFDVKLKQVPHICFQDDYKPAFWFPQVQWIEIRQWNLWKHETRHRQRSINLYTLVSEFFCFFRNKPK